MQLNGTRLSIGALIAAAAMVAMTSIAADTAKLETQKEKLSYGIGVDVAKNLKRLSVDVDPDIIARAIHDVMGEKQLLLSDDDIRRIMTAHQTDLRQRQAKLLKAASEERQREATAFLESNKAKEGVVALPSGLQYKILNAGTGPKPGETNLVELRWRGTFVNGTEFDSSEKLGKPSIQKIAATMPGWREALRMMPAGSKWQLFLPPALAVGSRPPPRDPGASAVLIYELELVGIR
ncbi:MAG TPA: hypothetical protein DCM86_18210 [Verrucomicrobiales bacterium]|nr:hypothetical protein [Verrucomicrobiales bacterium]